MAAHKDVHQSANQLWCPQQQDEETSGLHARWGGLPLVTE